ncbi:hypothetical protein [Paraburkholderia terrae]|uniref:hypothetical protein n=1 Tax=Paraburkholderia terrae TaxID=311230 RepID=UPI003084149B
MSKSSSADLPVRSIVLFSAQHEFWKLALIRTTYFSQLLSDEVMTPGNSKAGNRSPYTFRDIDAAIAHLEAVLDKEGASSLFSRAYWRERVLQASSTTGLAPKQQQRLHRLLARIETF